MTQPLSGLQWLATIGLALLLPVVVEVSKWMRRRRAPAAGPLDAPVAVAPVRARSERS
jgi:Ca2+-transporting ATPase